MLQVAAYCRVSTDKEDQANSFEAQQRYFREYIQRQPDWELQGIYADEGFSGTSTNKRVEFNKMLHAAELGQIDLIVTKEVSRFTRNTVDALQITRELRRRGVGVLFLNDSLDTRTNDGELRLTIMSSFAQDESRRTSERSKWGQMRSMEKGVVFGGSLLGYDVIGGKMTVNPEGAEVVRLIFHKYLQERKGCSAIARELREAGILSSKGNCLWSSATVTKILKNEKYCGDLIQKKTYTPDYLTHEKKYNHGKEPLVELKDHHEPIIDRIKHRALEQMVEVHRGLPLVLLCIPAATVRQAAADTATAIRFPAKFAAVSAAKASLTAPKSGRTEAPIIAGAASPPPTRACGAQTAQEIPSDAASGGRSGMTLPWTFCGAR